MTKTLLLDCGSGGRASQRLINELFLEQFDNPILRTLDDAAKLDLSGPIAMSTDGYTVTPLFFPVDIPTDGKMLDTSLEVVEDYDSSVIQDIDYPLQVGGIVIFFINSCAKISNNQLISKGFTFLAFLSPAS